MWEEAQGKVGGTGKGNKLKRLLHPHWAPLGLQRSFGWNCSTVKISACRSRHTELYRWSSSTSPQLLSRLTFYFDHGFLIKPTIETAFRLKSLRLSLLFEHFLENVAELSIRFGRNSAIRERTLKMFKNELRKAISTTTLWAKTQNLFQYAMFQFTKKKTLQIHLAFRGIVFFGKTWFCSIID